MTDPDLMAREAERRRGVTQVHVVDGPLINNSRYEITQCGIRASFLDERRPVHPGDTGEVYLARDEEPCPDCVMRSEGAFWHAWEGPTYHVEDGKLVEQTDEPKDAGRTLLGVVPPPGRVETINEEAGNAEVLARIVDRLTREGVL